MINHRYRNTITNIKTYPGADCGSDHNLLLSVIQVKLKHTKRNRNEKRLRIGDLKINSIREKYESMTNNRLQNLNLEESVEELWENMKGEIRESAYQVLGEKRRKARRPWITKEVLEKMNERRRWKSANTLDAKEKYRTIDKQVKSMARKAKEDWLDRICYELEEHESSQNLRKVYQNIDLISRKKRRVKIGTIKNENGEILMQKERQLVRWNEYLTKLYKTEDNMECQLEEEYDNDETPKFLEDEVEVALKKLKNGKAPGIDGLQGKLLNSMGSEGRKIMSHVLNKILAGEQLPTDFINLIFIPIPKIEGTLECDKHRIISLISHISKVLTTTIYSRIELKIEAELNNTQFGFRKNKGTREAITLIRLIGENMIEKK
ncbi:uncharacterized protein LOC111615228 [Centruroides sculpturatus]|uniref:uncharacterized protein LOC111615228 n=1 Tax=Centruroides sculpturatus TaxID=218467 RepID=UPI000C6ED625|nr:uncharacterized protein LOC111615228 [Centruroides sculpturatus]